LHSDEPDIEVFFEIFTDSSVGKNLKPFWCVGPNVTPKYVQVGFHLDTVDFSTMGTIQAARLGFNLSKEIRGKIEHFDNHIEYLDKIKFHNNDDQEIEWSDSSEALAKSFKVQISLEPVYSGPPASERAFSVPIYVTTKPVKDDQGEAIIAISNKMLGDELVLRYEDKNGKPFSKKDNIARYFYSGSRKPPQD
jgi:hypothetical protein